MRLKPTHAVLLVALAPSCKQAEATSTGPPQAASAGPTRIRIDVARVVEKMLPQTLDFTGTLDAHERSAVAAQTAGVVRETRVDVGTRVKKGDVLALLDASEASLRLVSADATAEQQRARLGLDRNAGFDVQNVPEVRNALDGRDLAETQYERARKLIETGAIPQSELDVAKSNYERAEAQLSMARNGAQQTYAALHAAEAQARLSRKALGDTRIVAPFDGAVVERTVTAGEFAPLGKVVAVVVSDNPLRLRLDVPEADIASVAEGGAVDLEIAAYPEQRFSGTIRRVGASLDQTSRTLPVEADVPNEDGKLRPGFFAKAHVALSGPPRKALFVPSSAIGDSGSAKRVFVVSDGHVLERLVSLGRSLEGLVEVRGELEKGETVAANHVSELSDSLQVEVAR